MSATHALDASQLREIAYRAIERAVAAGADPVEACLAFASVAARELGLMCPAGDEARRLVQVAQALARDFNAGLGERPMGCVFAGTGPTAEG